MFDSEIQKIIAAKKNGIVGRQFTLPVYDESYNLIAELVCIDRFMVTKPEVVSKLSEWRLRYSDNFLTQFEISDDRTKRWLTDIVIPSTDRILFLIRLPTGELVGNFGVCNLTNKDAELDNTIRGERLGPAKLMNYCEVALLVWLFETFGCDRVYLHVFSNNITAQMLHKHMGFKLVKKIKLSKLEAGTTIQYVPAVELEHGKQYVDFDYLQLSISLSEFLTVSPWSKRLFGKI